MCFGDNCCLLSADDRFFEICEISRKEGEMHATTLLSEIMYPDDMQYVIKQIKNTMVLGETNFECYIKLLTFKKNIRLVVKTGKIRKDSEGIFIDVVVRDITDISNLNGKVDISEEKLKSVLEGASVTLWDIKKKSCLWSKEVQLSLGVPAESENLIDTLCTQNLLHGDSVELFRNVVDRLLHGEVSITEDFWYNKDNDKLLCRRVTLFAEHDENNEVVKIREVGRDVTKELLGKEGVDIEEIVKSMPGGIFVVDVETETLRYANDVYFEVIGYTREELKIQFNNMPRYIVYPEDILAYGKKIKTDLKVTYCGGFEGRIRRSDEKEIWVNVKTKKKGKNYFSIVTDITEQKRIISKLKYEQFFNQIVNSITEDIIVRFDMQTNLVQYTGRGLENFNIDYKPISFSDSTFKGYMGNSLKSEGFKVLQRNFPDSMLEEDIIYNEDLPVFMKIIQNIASGKEEPSEFRLKNIYGKVEWYRFEYRIAFEDEVPVCVVGRINNIEKEKMLVEQASVDTLTGCYNQGTTKIHINQVLKTANEKSLHAFIVVDIDNFKNINDNFGHLMGDTVLKDLAGKMKDIFRGSDFVGRIGGDEFVIFMCEYGHSNILEKKMCELVKVLQTTCTGVEGDYSISGSVGVAVYPDDGLTYEDLYCNADIALYVAKAKGKNQFCMYSKSMNTR